MKWLAAVALLVCAPAQADQIDDYERRLKVTLAICQEISTIAVNVCAAAEQSGYTETDRVVETANASAGALSALLVNANVSTVRQVDKSSWRGVLQSQIAESIRHTNECRYNLMVAVQNVVFIPSRAITKELGKAPPKQSAAKTGTRATGQPAAPASVPAAPSSTRTTLRVFLKDNLTERNLAILKTVLPGFDVVTGRSAIDKKNPADTLFVNRDKVAPAEVLEVARALAQMGVPIKSIQQSTTVAGQEIQVGTYPNQFKEKAPLDLAALARLQGPAFWVAGFNGLVFCSTGKGKGRLCAADADGRPILPGR
jgi:hypothetical protein